MSGARLFRERILVTYDGLWPSFSARSGDIACIAVDEHIRPLPRFLDRPEATVEYFVPDDRKAGGAYMTVTGRVRHISVPERTLVMEDGTVIPIEDVDSIVF